MTFLPGISEASVDLTPTVNASEASGAVTVTITPSANYEILGSPRNSVEIFSTGGPGPWINVFRRVDPVGNTLAEGGSKGQFVVSRYYAYPTGPPPQSIPTPPPLPGFALGGTAREGLDYTATKQATSRVVPPIASSMVLVDGYEVEITPLADGVYDNGEWAYLFADSLRAAGAISPMQLAEFRPVNFFGEGDFRHRERLLVNNWYFNPDLQGGGTNMYQFVNASRYPATPHQFMAKNAEGVWQYVWGPNEAAQDLWGDPGQNVANPLSLFFNHSLIKIGNVYYDPSYGKKFASRQEWEDQAVAGFIVLDNQEKRFLIRQNPTGQGIAADTEEGLRQYNGIPLPDSP